MIEKIGLSAFEYHRFCNIFKTKIELMPINQLKITGFAHIFAIWNSMKIYRNLLPLRNWNWQILFDSYHLNLSSNPTKAVIFNTLSFRVLKNLFLQIKYWARQSSLKFDCTMTYIAKFSHDYVIDVVP